MEPKNHGKHMINALTFDRKPNKSTLNLKTNEQRGNIFLDKIKQRIYTTIYTEESFVLQGKSHATIYSKTIPHIMELSIT
jgi:hypothetical protein